MNAAHSNEPVTEDTFDYAAAREHLQKKHAVLQAKRLALWQKAQAEAQAIIALIVRRYDPQKIIQWGSILAPQHFSEASDIDLAVAGVDPIVFLQLLGDAEALTDFPLDILRWEEMPPAFQKTILTKGKVVYVKD
ncbi:MAG: nucleotidyltransferase domain-containing protein [Anaerolineae bacterium]|nr:nucleotidyltransferase domain-containing protein [Anaerolineae bacterium]